MSAFNQEEWEAAYRAAISDLYGSGHTLDEAFRRIFLAGYATALDAIEAAQRPVKENTSARNDFEVCPVGTLAKLARYEGVRAGLTEQHPDLCHEHGDTHLRGSPACELALAKGRSR